MECRGSCRSMARSLRRRNQGQGATYAFGPRCGLRRARTSPYRLISLFQQHCKRIQRHF